LHHWDHEPSVLESPLKAQVIAIDEIVEHISRGLANLEVYASTHCGNGRVEDVDTSFWVSGSDDTSGVGAQDKIKGSRMIQWISMKKIHLVHPQVKYAQVSILVM
jgi:hypothetical protein